MVMMIVVVVCCCHHLVVNYCYCLFTWKEAPSKELSMSMQLVEFLPFSCYYQISTTIERAFDEYATCRVYLFRIIIVIIVTHHHQPSTVMALFIKKKENFKTFRRVCNFLYFLLFLSYYLRLCHRHRFL